MADISFTIDGVRVTTAEGTTVLQAALDNGIYIPHLCHDPDLKPVGVCRLCMVEIAGRGMTISCKTPAEANMVVRTESPEIHMVRTIATELLIANHHADCLSCARNTQCKLQEIANYVGIDEARLKRLRQPDRRLPLDTSSPFFYRDPNKCVLCGICVRACDELRGVGAIDYGFRGYATAITTFGNKPLIESRCESCGECLARCPVGALVPKEGQRPARQVRTICSYCGVGCGLYLGVRGGAVVDVSGDRASPVNRGSLCVKGRFGHDYINHPDRLASPLVRRDGRLVESTWDEALDLVADRLRAVRDTHGGDAIAVLASARCTNEENYLLQKLTRAVLGTHNVDHCARL